MVDIIWLADAGPNAAVAIVGETFVFVVQMIGVDNATAAAVVIVAQHFVVGIVIGGGWIALQFDRDCGSDCRCCGDCMIRGGFTAVQRLVAGIYIGYGADAALIGQTFVTRLIDDNDAAVAAAAVAAVRCPRWRRRRRGTVGHLVENVDGIVRDTLNTMR